MKNMRSTALSLSLMLCMLTHSGKINAPVTGDGRMDGLTRQRGICLLSSPLTFSPEMETYLSLSMPASLEKHLCSSYCTPRRKDKWKWHVWWAWQWRQAGRAWWQLAWAGRQWRGMGWVAALGEQLGDLTEARKASYALRLQCLCACALKSMPLLSSHLLSIWGKGETACRWCWR